MVQFNLAACLLFTCLIGLSGCGGSGGSSNNSSNPPTADLNGLYFGTVTQMGYGTFELVCLVQDGRLIAVSEEANTIYDGNVSTTSSGFSGTVTAYEQNGAAFDTVAINGNYDYRSYLSGTFSGSSGSTGSFSVNFESIYERDSDLSLLNDVWAYSDGMFSAAISIEPDGSLYATDSDGCYYSGTARIKDSSVNIYSVEFSTSNCYQSYTGYITLLDYNQPNDILIVVGSNQNTVFAYPFLRQ